MQDVMHRRRVSSEELGEEFELYDGILLLEDSDALLFENDDRIELEGIIVNP